MTHLNFSDGCDTVSISKVIDEKTSSKLQIFIIIACRESELIRRNVNCFLEVEFESTNWENQYVSSHSKKKDKKKIKLTDQILIVSAIHEISAHVH